MKNAIALAALTLAFSSFTNGLTAMAKERKPSSELAECMGVLAISDTRPGDPWYLVYSLGVDNDQFWISEEQLIERIGSRRFHECTAEAGSVAN